MSIERARHFLLLACAVLLTALSVAPRAIAPAPPNVAVIATPDDGIQPQVAVDANGVLHLVYFKGDPAGGDLYYVRLTSRDRQVQPTSPAVRINSIAGSALATGTVRGAQISLGRNGIVHVAWHGAKPVGVGANPPVWYTRSVDGATFEAQRAVSENTTGIDGSTVAADARGRVTVAWHGLGRKPGEGDRLVYLARSANDGAAFAPVVAATTAPVGACGCCGLKAMFGRDGTLNLIYRAAIEGTHRDTMWVALRDGAPAAPVRVHPWELEACPMSTYALAPAGTRVAAAWETAQQIYSATLDPATGSVSAVSAVPGTGLRKHPAIAVNDAGDRLLAWTDGTAWKRGGTFSWRVTSREGREIASTADAGPVPVWGLLSAVPLPDGSFVIFR